MDFKRPERCQRQRTGREDRRSKFYEISDNLARRYLSQESLAALRLGETELSGLTDPAWTDNQENEENGNGETEVASALVA
jgi:hypothetical protein